MWKTRKPWFLASELPHLRGKLGSFQKSKQLHRFKLEVSAHKDNLDSSKFWNGINLCIVEFKQLYRDTHLKCTVTVLAV